MSKADDAVGQATSVIVDHAPLKHGSSSEREREKDGNTSAGLV